MAGDDKINWNVDLEVGLFHAIHAHRPVGTHRYRFFFCRPPSYRMRNTFLCIRVSALLGLTNSSRLWIIPRLVSRLGSQVRFCANFRIFALRVLPHPT